MKIVLDTMRLALLQDRFNPRTVRGHAAHPSVLKQAGAKTPTCIARIRANDFLGQAAGINFAAYFLVFRQRSPAANRHPS